MGEGGNVWWGGDEMRWDGMGYPWPVFVYILYFVQVLFLV